MNTDIIISVDAMGGDVGPKVTIPAIAKACELHPDVRFLIYGLEADTLPLIAAYPIVGERSEFIGCDVAISMEEKPGSALRRGRKVSSMWQAIDAVKADNAQAAISAGNTGALMAMSKVVLRMKPGIERPALACIWPTLRGESIVLDVGATIGITASQYAQFAVMGRAYARVVLGVTEPTIGLLNVGVEDVKGTDNIREASEVINELGLNFSGFVEGDGIGRGDVDVVVTDGFTGNIALKTAEGTARQITTMLREAISASWMSRIGYVFARSAFNVLRERLDPNNANGGIFLGLNGIVIKSHGGADVDGFTSAIEVAIEVAKANINEVITRDIDDMQDVLENAWAERLL